MKITRNSLKLLNSFPCLRNFATVPHTQTQTLEKVTLTPHQLYVIQTRTMEKPFSGYLWQNKEIGSYHCSVCQTKLFTCFYKFSPEIYLSIWLRNFLGFSPKISHFRFRSQGSFKLQQYHRLTIFKQQNRISQHSLRPSNLTSVTLFWELFLKMVCLLIF